MPDVGRFCAGFNFIKGTTFGNIKIVDVTASEQTISRYREYSYDIVIDFQLSEHETPMDVNKSYQKFVNSLTNRVINTAYGNPYECSVRIVSVNESGDTLHVKLAGRSVRI